MVKHIAVSFFILIVFFVSAIFNVYISEAQDNWLTFRNQQFKFRFIYPPNWEIATPRGPNVRGSIKSPPNKPLGNCNIVVRQFTETSKLSQKEINMEIDNEIWHKQVWIEMFAEKFPDIIVHETKKIKVDNQPAQFATAMMSYETMRGKIYMKGMYFFTMTPGLGWTLSCSAGGKTQNDANQNYRYWEPIFYRIFSSFVFEK